MKRLELLIPPPVIMGLVAVFMWWLADMFSAVHEIRFQHKGLSVVLGFIGLVISLIAIIFFKRSSTTVDPKNLNKTTTLVSSGIYKYSRNPMYLGVLIMLLGWAFYLGNLLSLFGLALYVIYITRFQIVPEERYLKEKFGQQFLDYMSRTRRWL